MLTYLTLDDEATTAADDAEWAGRREALGARPLIEFPALRVAMGLPELPTPVATRWAIRPGTKRRPKNASAPATNTRTKHASTKAAIERRFDLRTLLETDC